MQKTIAILALANIAGMLMQWRGGMSRTTYLAKFALGMILETAAALLMIA